LRIGPDGLSEVPDAPQPVDAKGASVQIASLAMYVSPEPVAQATQTLWRFLRDYLRRAGLEGVPDQLNREVAHDDVWLRPDLLIAQTCGFPYVTSLRGQVRLVATPCYGYPGCDGPRMRSFVIARKSAAIERLEDLRGLTAAINSPDSNSGMNLFRAAIAPIAGGQSFFRRVIQTGGHVASVEAVATGSADCAAIDCITFGHIARFAPERLEDIVVIAQTPAGPGLPLVTRGSASDRELAVLREGLDAVLAEPSLRDDRETLALTGFQQLGDRDYDALLAFEAEAARLGYPQLS
jgi:ABC-type phosphate/phosphonate transport system substrate-binding protein